MVYLYLLVFFSFLNILLALIVFLKNPRNPVNVSFSLFVFFVIAWMMVNYLSNQFPDYRLAFCFNKLIFIVSPYISFSLLYFSVVFPISLFKMKPWYFILLLLPIVFSNILTLFNLTITGITFLPEGVTGVVFGPGIVIFGFQFLAYIILSIILLIIKYRRAGGYQRVQMQYVILGIAILTILGTITNLLVPLIYQVFWLSDIGPLLSFTVFGFTAYAILRHHLLNIKVVATNAFILFIWVTLFAKLFVSKSPTEMIVDIFILILVIIFGVLLAGSVRIEIKQKEKLQELSRKLTEIDKQKDEFISMAAHELRAPMTAIKGYLSMVIHGDTGDIPEKARGFLTDADSINERLIRLVNNMLNVSRIEENRIVYQIEEENLSAVVRAVFDQFRPEAERKGLKYDLNMALKIRDKVEVDPDRIHEVVANLLSNATKYTDKGYVKVRLTQPNPKTVRFEVEDSGPGISGEEQAKLFQKFQRAESTVGKTTGTGLGLYISRLLIEKFNGKIGVNSEVDKGSTFWFELPLKNT